ncbi:MAG TPA: HAMP domain-containing sensor histidine kinase [Gemmatimonadaceae bacterium]|jgi:signal transduction histidine kinase|nr:HAMP domain-containing sensor histidine kinase [Gemmatimonadaceae bacterium]
MRRGKPELFVAALILILLASYLWYTRRVIDDLRSDARRSSQMYARVFRAFGDTATGASDAALVDLLREITEQGVPLVVISPNGEVAAHANLPFDNPRRVPETDPRVRDYVAVLQRVNPPIVEPSIGKIYYGDDAVVRGLLVIPIIQVVTAAVLLLAGLYVIRTRGNAARERLWAGMARESAHQLGTPLSSLAGWVELLEDRGDDASTRTVTRHMRGDLERLDRVAHRFERIGREPKYEPLDVAEIVQRVGRYFQARVPTLANTIAIETTAAPDLHAVQGDPVLLEWAMEVLMKNAIDALAGRGGRVALSADHGADEDSVVIRVADDGPGIPSEIRSRVFEPGFSTKQSGWGIGLSLAKRIVEENHGGRLVLAQSEQGATFEIILH